MAQRIAGEWTADAPQTADPAGITSCFRAERRNGLVYRNTAKGAAMTYRMAGLLVLFGVLGVNAPAAGNDHRAQLDSAFVDMLQRKDVHAAARYRAVLQADSTCAEAYRFLGWLAIVNASGDLHGAGDLLHRAVGLHPGDAGAQNDLGFTYVFQHDYGPALAAFRTAEKLDAAAALYPRNLGMALLETGDFDGALTALRRSATLDSMNALTYVGMARALTGLRRHDEALRAYQRALNLEPQQVEGYLGMGDALSRQGEQKAAASAYEGALRVDFYDPRPHYALASLYRQMGDSIRASQETAKFRRLDRDYRYAVHERHVFPAQVDSLAAYRMSGMAYAQLGKYDEAIRLYQQGLTLAQRPGSLYRFSPEAAALHAAIGRAQQMLGNVAAARKAYREARNLDDGGMTMESARTGLADMYLFTEGLPAKEAGNDERIVAMQPVSAGAFWIYDRISQTHRSAGRLDACIAAYEAMLGKAPHSAGLLARLGVAYMAADRPNAAAAVFEQAAGLAEDPHELYRQLARLYQREGRTAEARAAEEKAKQ